jgi:type II secretory pathway pseudopilin PulG
MFRTRISEADGGKAGENGFTLAGLIVILTIISIIVAYSVPQQWSLIMQRERDRQTIFVMRQYARAVLGFWQKHQTLPNSLEQLREARRPRMIRLTASTICPLTGEEDWIMVPPQAVTAPQITPGGGPVGTPNASPTGRDVWNRTWDNTAGNRGSTATQPQQNPALNPTSANASSRLNPQLSPPDYKGQFVGVRPNKTGKSIVALNGIEDYGEWVFTYQDMLNEVTLRNQAIVTSK